MIIARVPSIDRVKHTGCPDTANGSDDREGLFSKLLRVALIAAVAIYPLSKPTYASGQKPNIVYVLADDLG